MSIAKVDLETLARTIWGEARGESWIGKVAIAWVVKNRADKSGRPIWYECEKPYQFSCWNRNDPNRTKLVNVTAENAIFQECLGAAAAVLADLVEDPTSGSRHYHTPAVSPAWSRGKEPVVKIGNHLFFNGVK